MPLHVLTICAHHQEVKIALRSLWYHHTYRWPSGVQVRRGLVEMRAFQPVLSQPVHQTATYRCDDTRGCVIQFWPPDDEHMCSKHVEAWNKLIVKQKCCASSSSITEIKIWTACSRTSYRTLPLTYWNKYLNNEISETEVNTGCPRMNVPDFERVFLMLNYTDITQNTYVQIWTVTEIMTREKCGLHWCRRTLRRPWRHTCPMRLPDNEAW